MHRIGNKSACLPVMPTLYEGQMTTYDAARKHAITWLAHSLELHQAGNYLSIGDGYDEYDRMLPREGLDNDDPLIIALEFWASWADTAEHSWHFYPGFAKDDWPRLAKILLEDLKANRRVSDKTLLESFSPKPRKVKRGIAKRLKGLLKRE